MEWTYKLDQTGAITGNPITKDEAISLFDTLKPSVQAEFEEFWKSHHAEDGVFWKNYYSICPITDKPIPDPKDGIVKLSPDDARRIVETLNLPPTEEKMQHYKYLFLIRQKIVSGSEETKFDSFDIVEAHAVYYYNWHNGSTKRDRARPGRKPTAAFLSLPGVKMRSDLGFESLTRNGRLIYLNLVEKWEGLDKRREVEMDYPDEEEMEDVGS